MAIQRGNGAKMAKYQARREKSEKISIGMAAATEAINM